MIAVARSRPVAPTHGARSAGDLGLVFYGDVAADVFELAGEPADVLRAAHERLQERGTTGVCAVACALGHELRIAWVGDCRAYLVRNGVPTRLTRDQTLAEQLGAEGFPAHGPEARIPLHRLGLRSAFVATLREPAAAGDRVVLVTAGAWKDRTDASILEAILEPDPERAAAILVNGPTQQDATALVMDGGDLPG